MRTPTLLAALAVLAALAACSGSEDYPATPATGPAPSAGASWSVPNQALSDEQALAFLDQRCTTCHQLDRVRKARSLAEWQGHLERMQAKPGALFATCDAIDLAHWLTKHYSR